MEKIYYIPTDRKMICLTFDDGPNDPTTPIILEILKTHNIKATFFVLVENAMKNPAIMEAVIREGHTIGLHGYNHKSFNTYPKLKTYRHIKRCLEIMEQQFGVQTAYFRPPYGTFPDCAETIANEFNLTPVGWSLMEADWKPSMSRLKTKNILARCSLGKIVVLHDGYRHYTHVGTTIENLQQMLPPLISSGYSFVSIPELVAAKTQLQSKVLNGIPLLHREIVDLSQSTVLFLYWDINYIDQTKKYMCPTCGSEFERCLFELQV
ncbi:MAG: polysaccharide deacetylase family protein, partial [Candidatus Bathyarchaeia archaeon]